MIRVLVADDSPVFTDVLCSVLADDVDFTVVGTATDGAAAVERTRALRPDVVLMDVLMPVLDGFEAVTAIMADVPTPVLMLTADPRGRSGELAFEALRRGAIDLIPKPDHWPLSDHELAALRARIRDVSQARPIRHLDTRWRRAREESFRPRGQDARVIGVVSSTGGPAALRTLVAALPKGFAAALVVVQHLPTGFVDNLARWLAGAGTLAVRVARDGERCEPGTVLLAPDDMHSVIDGAGCVHLTREPADAKHRPSGDVLLGSIASSLGPAGAAVVLTGMGSDGARGLRAVHDAGGKTIAQDEPSCVVYGMPKAAVECCNAARVLTLADIPSGLRAIAGARRDAI